MSNFRCHETYKKTREPLATATTLPPVVYRDNEVFTVESEAVFAHAWVCVGYTSQVDVPGKMLTATVAGQPVVITKDKLGLMRGFYNVCRHRGSLLVETDAKLERFRCPYHSWTYDLTGKLLNCPLFTTEINKDDYHLLPIRVETFGCFIFVNLDPKASPLKEFLGDLPTIYQRFPLDELILVKRKHYAIKANWKLVAENFLEYYHLPWVHPELCTVSAIDMHKRNQGTGMYMSFFASPLLKGNTPLDSDYFPPMPGLNMTEQDSGYFPFVFPNLAMFLFPHHLFVLLMRPSGPDHTEEVGDILVHKNLFNEKNYEDKLSEIFKFYDMVNMQDILAVERVQQGLMTKAFSGGRFCERFEEPVHRFQNMWIDFMVNERRIYAGDNGAG